MSCPSFLNGPHYSLLGASSWNPVRTFLSSLCCLSPLFLASASIELILCILRVSFWTLKRRPPASGPYSIRFNYPIISVHLLMKIREKEAFVLSVGLLVIKWLCSFDCWKFCWLKTTWDVRLRQLWSSYFFPVLQCLKVSTCHFFGKKYRGCLLWRQVAFW